MDVIFRPKFSDHLPCPSLAPKSICFFRTDWRHDINITPFRTWIYEHNVWLVCFRNSLNKCGAYLFSIFNNITHWTRIARNEISLSSRRHFHLESVKIWLKNLMCCRHFKVPLLSKENWFKSFRQLFWKLKKALCIKITWNELILGLEKTFFHKSHSLIEKVRSIKAWTSLNCINKKASIALKFNKRTRTYY